MVRWSACRSLTCWPAARGCTRVVEFQECWGQGPAALQGLRWEKEGQRMCPGT